MEETLHSILNQTFTDFELILSDNGEIAEAYARQDDRIRYCPKRENYGGRLECASRLRARRHIGQSSTILPARLIQPRLRLTNRYCTLPCPEWWDPAKARALTFPEFRQLLEYFLSIYRAPLGAGQKLRCYFLLLPWIKIHLRHMLKELAIAADQVLYDLQVAKTRSTDFTQEVGTRERKAS